MTGIRRTNQGFIPETKTHDTHIAYNTVVYFYLVYAYFIFFWKNLNEILGSL